MKRLAALIAISTSALFLFGCSAAQPTLPDELTVTSDYLAEGLSAFDNDVLSETVQNTETVSSAIFDGGEEQVEDLREAFESLGFEQVVTATSRGTGGMVVSATASGYEVVVHDNGDGTYTYSATKW